MDIEQFKRGEEDGFLTATHLKIMFDVGEKRSEQSAVLPLVSRGQQ